MTKTIKIDSNAARQIFENAIRTQAQVALESPSWSDRTINGYIISGDDEALLMEMTGRPALDIAFLVGTTCDVHMYADQTYHFATSITATPQWGQSRAIALARPADIRVLERRRSHRAKLAPSSQVRLEWTHEGLARRYTAAMLNISPDGLACRIEAPVREAVDIGDVLLTRFQIPYGTRAFELEGRVRNITPTDEGRTILGLQFVRTGQFGEALEVLGRALQGKPVPVRMEVCA